MIRSSGGGSWSRQGGPLSGAARPGVRQPLDCFDFHTERCPEGSMTVSSDLRRSPKDCFKASSSFHSGPPELNPLS